LRCYKREECGVFGVYSRKEDVAERIYYGLMTLQHRGQDSAGTSILNGSKLSTKKVPGLAESLSSHLPKMKGRLGVGHVRYSTTASASLINAQPFTINSSKCPISLVYNGNIVNYVELRRKLQDAGVTFRSRTDAEMMLALLRLELDRSGDMFEAFRVLVSEVESSFSVAVLMGDGRVMVARDPFGFKPLCWGQNSETIVFASESVALDINKIRLLDDVKPGEAIVAGDGGVERKDFASSKRRAHCMFEYVYFSRPDSVIDGRSVYDVRYRLGINLAKTYESKADVIIPVPDTSRTAAEGLSKETGLPVAEGLIKNRYVQRTFIMPSQRLRENAVKIKLNPLKTALHGKRVILVDDSIVRGTTLRGIIKMVKESGARDVHVRITCPPIVSPCFYGIDIATHMELIAANKSVEEIQKILEADSLGYQTIDGLVEAIGMDRGSLCLACLTGQYPTPKAQTICEKLRNAPYTNRVRYWERGES